MFDVVDMDICHIIFSRPWQYNGNAIYKAHENIYLIENGGQKVHLHLFTDEMSSPKSSKDKTPKILEEEIKDWVKGSLNRFSTFI